MPRRAVIIALLSATLFGFSTPAAKALLLVVHPAILAGLLYVGAGIGIGLLRRLRQPILGQGQGREAVLARADIPWLAGAIVAGGIIGPLLLMAGLTHTDAATASLLLTLEGVATALLAWFAFHEHYDHRIAVGI